MTPDLQPLNPADYSFGPNVWNDPRSYAPDLNALLAEGHRQSVDKRVGRFGFANRAATPSGLSRLRRLRASIASTIAEHFVPAVFGFIAGLAAVVIPAIILTHGAIL